VVEYPPKGLKNRDLAALALRGGYALVIRGHDSANTVLHPPERFHGIVILHIHPPKAEKLIERMERLLATVESYERKLIMVREDAIEVFEDADLAPRARAHPPPQPRLEGAGGGGGMRVSYDPEADVLYIVLREGPVKDTVEAEDDVLIEIAEDGGVAGIEVWNASKNVLEPIAKALSVKIKEALEAAAEQ